MDGRVGDGADLVGVVEELGPNLTYLIYRGTVMWSAFCIRGQVSAREFRDINMEVEKEKGFECLKKKKHA